MKTVVLKPLDQIDPNKEISAFHEGSFSLEKTYVYVGSNNMIYKAVKVAQDSDGNRNFAFAAIEGTLYWASGNQPSLQSLCEHTLSIGIGSRGNDACMFEFENLREFAMWLCQENVLDDTP